MVKKKRPHVHFLYHISTIKYKKVEVSPCCLVFRVSQQTLRYTIAKQRSHACGGYDAEDVRGAWLAKGSTGVPPFLLLHHRHLPTNYAAMLSIVVLSKHTIVPFVLNQQIG